MDVKALYSSSGKFCRVTYRPVSSINLFFSYIIQVKTFRLETMVLEAREVTLS